MTRPSFDLSLYLVLDPGLIAAARRSLEDTLRDALAGGVSIVQLRDKELPDSEFSRLALHVQRLLAGSGVPLIINDRVQVAAEIGADGVHVGQGDMPASEVRRRLGPSPILGLSVSRAEELEALDPALVDYVGIGPIFPTSTKLDTVPALGVESITRARARLSVPGAALPLVAIGGIQLGNAASVIAAGADGIAVVSAICSAPDVRQAALSLYAEVERGRQRSGENTAGKRPSHETPVQKVKA